MVAVFQAATSIQWTNPQLLASFDRNFVGNVVCSLDGTDDDGVLFWTHWTLTTKCCLLNRNGIFNKSSTRVVSQLLLAIYSHLQPCHDEGDDGNRGTLCVATYSSVSRLSNYACDCTGHSCCPKDIELLSFQGFSHSFEQIVIGVAIGFVTQFWLGTLLCSVRFRYAIELGLRLYGWSSKRSEYAEVLGQLFMLLATMFFLATDGHLKMLQLVVFSFTTLPIGSGSSLTAVDFRELALWLGIMFKTALAMSFIWHLLRCSRLTSLFGVMTRAAPQLNIFSLGFAFALLIGSVTLFGTSLAAYIATMSCIGYTKESSRYVVSSDWIAKETEMASQTVKNAEDAPKTLATGQRKRAGCKVKVSVSIGALIVGAISLMWVWRRSMAKLCSRPCNACFAPAVTKFWYQQAAGNRGWRLGQSAVSTVLDSYHFVVAAVIGAAGVDDE